MSAVQHSGECWTYDNTQIRAQKNITMGRTFVSRHQSDRRGIIIFRGGSGWTSIEATAKGDSRTSAQNFRIFIGLDQERTPGFGLIFSYL